MWLSDDQVNAEIVGTFQNYVKFSLQIFNHVTHQHPNCLEFLENLEQLSVEMYHPTFY